MPRLAADDCLPCPGRPRSRPAGTGQGRPPPHGRVRTSASIMPRRSHGQRRSPPSAQPVRPGRRFLHRPVPGELPLQQGAHRLPERVPGTRRRQRRVGPATRRSRRQPPPHLDQSPTVPSQHPRHPPPRRGRRQHRQRHLPHHRLPTSPRQTSLHRPLPHPARAALIPRHKRRQQRVRAPAGLAPHPLHQKPRHPAHRPQTTPRRPRMHRPPSSAMAHQGLRTARRTDAPRQRRPLRQQTLRFPQPHVAVQYRPQYHYHAFGTPRPRPWADCRQA